MYVFEDRSKDTLNIKESSSLAELKNLGIEIGFNTDHSVYVKLNGETVSASVSPEFREWVETQLATKVDKITNTSANPRVYGVTENGEQSTYFATQTPNANTVPLRDASGSFQVADGVAPKQVVNKSQLDLKLDSKGGTITGDLAVQGDLTITGTTKSEKNKSLIVEDNVIVTNANKVSLQALLSGLAINKGADATYGIMYDPADDAVKFGQGTLDKDNKFAFSENEGLPLAVRDKADKLTNAHFLKWDSASNKLTDSGYAADDFVDTTTQQSIAGMKTFTDEVHFGATHFSKDLSIDGASVKIFNTQKDLVTQYKPDSITIDNGTGSSATQYVLTIPKKNGTLAVDAFKYSSFNSSTDGDTWTLSDSTKNIELKYQDDNSYSSILVEKDYAEMLDINGTGTAKINISSNIITLDSETKEGQHKLIRVTPDKISIGNSTDTLLMEIDSSSAKFNNRPQVRDNGNYVNVALASDLDNHVFSQSETADKYYAQLSNNDGIISARIFKNGEDDVQNIIISKDGVTLLGNKIVTENQLTSKAATLYDHCIVSAIKVDNVNCSLATRFMSTKSDAYTVLSDLPLTRMENIAATLIVTDTDGNSYKSQVTASYYADRIYVSGVYIKSDATVAALQNAQVDITTAIEADSVEKIA